MFDETKLYDVVTVFGIPMLFTEDRIEPSEVPEGIYKYEVRKVGDEWDSVGDWFIFGFAGSLLSKVKIQPEESDLTPRGKMYKPVNGKYKFENKKKNINTFIKELLGKECIQRV